MFKKWMSLVLALMIVGIAGACSNGVEEETGLTEEDVDVEVVVATAHSVEYSVDYGEDTVTVSLDAFPEDVFDFEHWLDLESDEIIGENETLELEAESGDAFSLEAVFSRQDVVVSDYLSGGFEDFLEMPLDAYYQPAEGLYGDDLRNALDGILNEDVTRLSYDDLKTVLEESDEDPDNPDNIILIYTRESVQGEWDFPNWNREHVWPQSMFGSADAKTDAHHVAPSDVDENSARGSDPFSETEPGSYEPHDDVKGDVARMLFYMDARYDNLSLSDDPSGNEMGYLSELLEWHFEDPVDEFERQRNDVIFTHQGNRNPFIDHPHLAWLMYYDHPVVGFD